MMDLQDWDGVVGEGFHLLRPGGGRESRGVTPAVIIESEEINPLIVGTAIHVLGRLQSIFI